MEKKFNRGKEMLVEKLDLPKDVILDVPKIIVIGRNEITIENHKGIMVFEKDRIKINTNMSPIEIKGNSFEILYIASATITIKDVLGADASIGIFKNSGGEDFHYYTQKLKCKTTYIGLGADATPGFHNPNVTFDTKALEYGVDIWCRLVEKRLG